MTTAKVVTQLLHDFDHAMERAELDVELLTQLFSEIGNHVLVLQPRQKSDDAEQLKQLLEWLLIKVPLIEAKKLIVAEQLACLQKQRLASKTYSSHQ